MQSISLGRRAIINIKKKSCFSENFNLVLAAAGILIKRAIYEREGRRSRSRSGRGTRSRSSYSLGLFI